ncbi:uncharacterized protein Z518_09221 [Rhinocladiella mackenziei CBS 650.93]|uniref:Nephrocystin 3-like N-terminal domain-containing protein n=1 Tax=Rhinocladiella mackenziei CBS 650.93 TaxID=1442369 RepID=A0A0D2IY69_9EURO|nr:uncharacterized protein Z518_09221 [Rhinocladiella mackenziei CBS 650.93]KIX01495.1 hypothetical protein Z518_09221 [Rhinocladiella mackenziei CBS 650.93]
MSDPAVSLGSYAQNIIAITSFLRKRHRDNQAKVNLLDEARRLAREIRHAVSTFPRDLNKELKDELEQLSLSLSDVREAFISAKSRNDLQDAIDNLRTSNEKIREIHPVRCSSPSAESGDPSQHSSTSPARMKYLASKSPINHPDTKESEDEIKPTPTYQPKEVYVAELGSVGWTPAKATIDADSSVNLISERFLDSLGATSSWSHLFSRHWSWITAPFYKPSRKSQTWAARSLVKLKMAYSPDSPPHVVPFEVHYGVSFFGDLLLGQDLPKDERLQSPPGSWNTAGQRLRCLQDPQQGKKADIIFVHSAHCDTQGTWRNKSDTFWPRDLLAKDVDRCSIWTYDCDLSRTLANSVESLENKIEDLTSDLLEQIRQKTNKYPILWICHSLGGHVVKNALTRTMNTSPFQTKGIIFLGTPHRVNTSTDIYEDLIADSFGFNTILTEVQSQRFDNSIRSTASAFACLMDRRPLPVLSLFETKATMTKRGPRTIAPQITRLYHPQESWGVLEGDHSSICKFETREEKGYKKIVASVRDLLAGELWTYDWHRSIELHLQSRPPSRLTTSTSLSLDAEPIDIDKMYLNFRLKIDWPSARWTSPKPQDQVDATWIGNEPLVVEWMKREDARPLVIRGNLGSGKTRIAESIQEWLYLPPRRAMVRRASAKICNLSYFFKSDQRSQQTPNHMLRSLITQTLDQNEVLIYHIKEKPFKNALNRFAPLRAYAILQATLRMLLENTCWSSINLVVDGLDECDPKHTRDLLNSLDMILQIGKVRALLTVSTAMTGNAEASMSVLNNFITGAQCLVLDLPKSPAWNRHLAEYLDVRLREMNGFQLGTRDRELLQETLLSLPNRSFVIFDLALQHLRDSSPHWESLSSDLLKSRLEELKDRAKIDGLLLDLANTAGQKGRWILSFLACAFGPFRIQALAEILARTPEVEWKGAPDKKVIELQSLVDKDLRLLVHADSDGLHLAGQLVRQVIHGRMASSEVLGPDKIKFSNDWCNYRQLHLLLSKTCLQILLDSLESRSDPGPEERMGRLAAEEYASRHWQDHLREAGHLAPNINGLVISWMEAPRETQHENVRPPENDSFQLLRRLTEENLFETLGTVFDEQSPDLELPSRDDIDQVLDHSTTPLLPDTIRALQNINKLAGRTEEKKTETFLALRERKLEELARLLDPLDASQKSKYLRKSIEMQDAELVQTVLDSFAKDREIPKRSTELAYAVQFKSVEIVRLMLQRKELFELDAALLGAVDVANFSMCQELLAHGAKVTMDRDKPSKATPLHLASRRGEIHLVDLMLEWGAPVNIKDSRGSSPLHHAARSGRVDIIKALVRGSASLIMENKSGQTALFSACTFGQTEAMKLLWSLGSNILHKDALGRSMLHTAAKHGHRELVDILVAAGISAVAKDRYDRTPIHEACKSGWASIVDKLLQAGAPVQVADKFGWTCLHYACQCRDVPEGVVQLLLDRGADASAADRKGRTPLMIAVQYSTVRVLKIFWTHDQSLFWHTDADGCTVSQYLRKTGGDATTTTAELEEEKEEFLRAYIPGSYQSARRTLGIRETSHDEESVDITADEPARGWSPPTELDTDDIDDDASWNVD